MTSETKLEPNGHDLYGTQSGRDLLSSNVPQRTLKEILAAIDESPSVESRVQRIFVPVDLMSRADVIYRWTRGEISTDTCKKELAAIVEAEASESKEGNVRK